MSSTESTHEKFRIHNRKISNSDNTYTFSFAFTKLKNILKRKKYPSKVTPTVQPITPLYLEEGEWFRRKRERDIGKVVTNEEASIPQLQRCITCKRIINDCGLDTLLYKEYRAQPGADNIPVIEWHGPLMKRCGCPMEDCECRGNMFLPPKRIPYETRPTWHYYYYLQALTCFKWKPPEQEQSKPVKTFPERLLDSVEAEMEVYKKLREIGMENRGAEYCMNRCFYYQLPEAKEDNTYISLKNQLLEEYKARTPVVVVEEKEPEDKDVPIIDGYYRSLSTQSTTDENGEFIIDRISHILFTRLDNLMLRDIEGKKLNVYSQKKFQEVYQPEDMASKLSNLFSLQGIKTRFSKLTNDILSSILTIKDTGIPMRSQSTQDPPLDDHQAVEIPSIDNFFEVEDKHNEETCPCCEFYKNSKSLTGGIANDDLIPYDADICAKIPSDVPQYLSSDNKKAESHDILEEIIDNIIRKNKDNLSPDLPVQKQLFKNTVEELKERDVNEIIHSSEEFPIAKKGKPNNYKKINNKIAEGTSLTKISQNNDMHSNKPSENDVSKKQISNVKGQSKPNLIKSGKKIKITDALLCDKDKPIINVNGSNNEKCNIEVNPHGITSDIEPETIDQIKKFESNKTQTRNQTSKPGDTDVRVFLKKKGYQSTQKPSYTIIHKITSKIPDEFEIKNKRKKSLSFDSFKVNIQKSFQRTSSAFSSFFKCLVFKSGNIIKNSKDSIKNEKNDEIILDELSNDSNNRDSKISEKEMFSLQYNSHLMTDTKSSEGQSNPEN